MNSNLLMRKLFNYMIHTAKSLLIVIFTIIIASCVNENDHHMLCNIDVTYGYNNERHSIQTYYVKIQFSNLFFYFSRNGKCIIKNNFYKNMWTQEIYGKAYIRDDNYICELDNNMVFEINRFTKSIIGTQKNQDYKYFGSCKKLSKI